MNNDTERAGDPIPRPAAPRVRLVLGSASPARLSTLRKAGLDPEVVVSGVPEDGIHADSPAELAGLLARHKAEAVMAQVGSAGSVPGSPLLVVMGCDSVLELDGQAFGKPYTGEVARQRWHAMRGRSGVLHTGHCVMAVGGDSPHGTEAAAPRRAEGVASTVVHFADLDDEEIEAYIATGEPLQLAGAFTIDGYGGAFVTRIEGDHHNVVGISLPLLRDLMATVGVRWTDLWAVR